MYKKSVSFILFYYFYFSLTFAIVPSLSKQQMTVVLPSDSNKFVDLVSDKRSHFVNKDKNLSQTASTQKKKKKVD